MVKPVKEAESPREEFSGRVPFWLTPADICRMEDDNKSAIYRIAYALWGQRWTGDRASRRAAWRSFGNAQASGIVLQ